MTRAELLQKLIHENGYQKYIEIGIYKGKTFFPLECKNKVAVDPVFKLSPGFILKYLLRNPGNIRNRYFFTTSDQFFGTKKKFLKAYQPDLVFIDGLHTFEASLKDALNSLKYLQANGTIVLHDCFPPDKAAATPASTFMEAKEKAGDEWGGTWCGDVWKTMAYLKEKYPEELEVSVLNTDMGLGVLQFNALIYDLNVDEELFKKWNTLSFDFLQENAEELINLIPYSR